jgi:hypothetical protein
MPTSPYTYLYNLHMLLTPKKEIEIQLRIS